MAENDKSEDIPVQECLKQFGISLLSDWDVLIFLYRHQFSLVSAEQIGRFLGYSGKTVSDALDRLESRGLVERSRSSQGVRFYRFVFPAAHLSPEGCFQQLMGLGKNRTGRLLVIKHLRQGVGLHIAAKGTTKWPKPI